MNWDEWRRQQEREAKAREAERRERLRAQAMETVRDYLKVRWLETRMPAVRESTKTKTVMACIRELAGRKTGKRPSLLLFISREEKNGRPTRQAEASRKLLEGVFAGEVDPGRLEKADLRVPLALLFFDCFLVDVTEVTSRDNRFINNHSVPFAVFADAGGKIGRVAYTAGQCKCSFVLGAVYRLLHAERPRFKDTLSSLNRELVKFLLAEYRVHLHEQNPEALRAAVFRVQRESELDAVLAQVKREEQERFLAELDRYDAAKSIFFSLREAGIAPERLPPKPRRPKHPDLRAASRALRKLLRFKARNVKLPQDLAGIYFDLQGFAGDVIARAGKDFKPSAPFLVCCLAFSGRKEDFSPRVAASVDVWASLFRGLVQPREPAKSDFRPTVVARLFNSVFVNVMKVEPGPGREVSKASAPLILFVEPGGKVLAALRTEKERAPAQIYERMRGMLAGKECARLVTQADAVLHFLLRAAREESAAAREVRLLSDALRALKNAPPLPFLRGRKPPALALVNARQDRTKKRQESARRDRERAEAEYQRLLAGITRLGLRKFEPRRLAEAKKEEKTSSVSAAGKSKSNGGGAKAGKGPARKAKTPPQGGKRTYAWVRKRELRAGIAGQVGRRVRMNFVYRGLRAPSAEASRFYSKMVKGGARELVNERNYLDARVEGLPPVQGIHVVIPPWLSRKARKAQPGDTVVLDCRVETGRSVRGHYFLRVESLELPPPRRNTP